MTNPSLIRLLILNEKLWLALHKRSKIMGSLKYLSLLLQGRSIAVAYKEETGAGKPAYLSRRFIGVVATFIGLAVSTYFGITLDANIIASISDSISTIISALVVLYGLLMVIVGIIRKGK